MKADIQPVFYADTVVTCACGSHRKVGSTAKELHTEICSNCHPFFTGKQKLVDTTGTVDRFKKKLAAAEKHKASATAKKSRKPRAKSA